MQFALDSHVTFDLLTAWSLHAESISWTMSLHTLVLAQASFLSENGQTSRQTYRCNWSSYPCCIY